MAPIANKMIARLAKRVWLKMGSFICMSNGLDFDLEMIVGPVADIVFMFSDKTGRCDIKPNVVVGYLPSIVAVGS